MKDQELMRAIGKPSGKINEVEEPESNRSQTRAKYVRFVVSRGQASPLTMKCAPRVNSCPSNQFSKAKPPPMMAIPVTKVKIHPAIARFGRER